MKPVSISLRIAGWYGGISLVGLAVFGVLMWFVLAASLLSWKDRTLQMRADRVHGALAAGDRGAALAQRLSGVVGSLPEGERIRIVGADGTLLFPAGAAGTAAVLDARCTGVDLRDLRVSRAETLRLRCEPVQFAGLPATLLIPTSLAEDSLLLRTFTESLLKTIPLILLVAGLGGYMLSRRALRPVDLLIAEARTLSASDLSRRLTVSPPDDQLRRLALEWNSLLERIESAMTRVAQFTADASHELRNPVAYIRTTAEYSLGNPLLDAESRAAFQAIADETGMMADLLETLLTLARPENVAPAGALEEVDLPDALADVVAHLAPLAAKKQQTLVCRAESEPVPARLRIDRLHLLRAVSAVVENAIKYTPPHGRIVLSWRLAGTLEVEVADNGIGIAAANLERIFDRFFRVDRARTDTAEGVGLGLSIARFLTERYGGRIAVQSKPGRGSTFTLHFPLGMVGSAAVRQEAGAALVRTPA